MQRLRHRYGTRATLTLIACLLLTSVVPLTPVRAADREVYKATDDGTPGTLRREIADARAGDRVYFSALLTGTIALRSQIVIDKDLTITRQGETPLTVQGSGTERVFYVAKGFVTISRFTIAGGRALGGFAGGGIAVETGAALTLMNSTLTDNWSDLPGRITNGGGIFTRGTVTVINSTFSDNLSNQGGAISAEGGTLTVTNSTFSANRASYGGGIFAKGGTLTVTNSTFSGNLVSGSGGGIFTDGDGTANLGNTTVSGNTAADSGGGIVARGTRLTGRNITVANNTAGSRSGGIHVVAGKELSLGNSLLIGNSPVDLVGELSPQGAFARYEGANNLFNSVEGAFSNTPPESNILRDTTAVLGPLADNGGPTQTHALLPGGTPVNRGSTDLCAQGIVNNKDQRGVARAQDALCDIGAFELEG